jgi:hypothetical protein
VPAGVDLEGFTRRGERRSRDLPGRDDPPDHEDALGDLRRGLPRVPLRYPAHYRRRGRTLQLHQHDSSNGGAAIVRKPALNLRLLLKVGLIRPTEAWALA